MVFNGLFRTVAAAALVGSSLFGRQTLPAAQQDGDVFNQAPEDLKDAVRARAKLFYDCYLTGKFRQAEEYVAPDSKDDYYNVEKDRYHSYKISRIDFTDNFSKAKVMVIINVDFKFQGHVMQVDVPIVSTWKAIDNQWFWYAVPKTTQVWNSPMGPIKAQTDPPADGKQPQAGSGAHSTDPRAMQAMFAIMPVLDKPVLTLNSQNQYQDSTFMLNRSQRPLKFLIETEPLEGLVLEPTSGTIAPGTSLTIRAAYKKSARGVVEETQHKAFISVESGPKVEMYVNVEPGTAKGSN